MAGILLSDQDRADLDWKNGAEPFYAKSSNSTPIMNTRTIPARVLTSRTILLVRVSIFTFSRNDLVISDLIVEDLARCLEAASGASRRGSPFDGIVPLYIMGV